MFGVVQLLGSLGTYLVGMFAAKWGYKVALGAAIVGVYVAVWAVIVAAISALILLVPVHPFPEFLLQFFPDRSAIGIAGAAYWGTAATMRSYDYWRLVSGVVAKVGS